MFFELNDEKRIGYKQLTDADLGRSLLSHQTHIGLFDDVLTYLPNYIDLDDAMVIYDNKVEIMSVSFGRIETPKHSFRSPNIKTGGRGTISVVSYIRDKVSNSSASTRWFLFWFGLKSGQPVFFFFNDASTTYSDIISLGIALQDRVKSRLVENDPLFEGILHYLENVVNKSGFEEVKELELIAQGAVSSERKYRKYDVDRANSLFREIGKEGEELVDRFFAKQLKKNYIQNYCWMNKDFESGKPYDFYFEMNNGEIIYLDVKTTRYDFEQKMVFSNQEIQFVSKTNNKYHIYRVYSSEGNIFLKICDNAKSLFCIIHDKTSAYERDIHSLATVETIKMAIQPLQCNLAFGREISLI